MLPGEKHKIGVKSLKFLETSKAASPSTMQSGRSLGNVGSYSLAWSSEDRPKAAIEKVGSNRERLGQFTVDALIHRQTPTHIAQRTG